MKPRARCSCSSRCNKTVEHLSVMKTPIHSVPSFRSLRVLLLLLLLRLPLLQSGSAMPADPRPFDFTQPDGTKVKLRLRGDEFFHWHEDMTGFAVVRDGERFVYATLDPGTGQMRPTEYLAGKVDPRTAGLAPGQVTPSSLRPPNLNEVLKPYRPWAAKADAKENAPISPRTAP